MQNDSNRDIQKRTVGLVIAGVVLIAAVVLYGVVVLDRVRGIEANWKTFSTVTIVRDAQIHHIQQELGYGGFIHNFKNFILRGDLGYMDRARDNLSQIRRSIDILRQETLTEPEHAALSTLVSSVNVYEVKLDFADNAFMDGLSTNEVDSLAILDDRATLTALKTLVDASARRLEQVQVTAEQQLASTIRFAALGLLAVPLIILVGVVLYRATRSLTRAHAEIRAASERLEGLLDTSPEAMIVADDKGVIVRANRAATDMLDYERGELIGKPLVSIIPEESRKQHTVKFGTFIKAPRYGVLSIEGDIYALTKKGREIPIEISLSALEQGPELLISATVRDITLRQAYENALVDAREKAIAASDEKSRFLANMSHEIRTPINAVIGLSALALKTDMNAKQLDYTRKIFSSGRRLLEVVNDILDFSKIEAGKLEIERSRFLLGTVLRDLTATLGPRAEEKQIELIVQVSPDVPNALIGDPLHLGQVLSNLISNAIKFTEAGTVIVQGDVDSTSNDARVLRFSVTDTGIGIPADDAAGLFDAFTQADTSATRRFGGTGLGLALCKNIVDAMGGEIGVTSEPGNGSTFTFTVPLEEDSDTDVGSSVSTSADSGDMVLGDAARGKRVLVVEDNSLNQQVVREILENEGLLVDTADNGRIALDVLFKQGPGVYSAILMDVQMPEKDGITATREIRADPSFDDVPIIALTAHALNEDRQRCLDAGMDSHLTKPIIADDLIAALNTWIAGVAPQDERPKAPPLTDGIAGGESDNSASAVDVSELPVINLEKASAISRLSKGFLEELLCDFKDRYDGAAAVIRGHLDAGERAEAQTIAHTVKGISGSLGAEQVFATSVALDAGLKAAAPDETIDQLYDDFAVSLAALLVYIEQNVARPE